MRRRKNECLKELCALMYSSAPMALIVMPRQIDAISMGQP